MDRHPLDARGEPEFLTLVSHKPMYIPDDWHSFWALFVYYFWVNFRVNFRVNFTALLIGYPFLSNASNKPDSLTLFKRLACYSNFNNKTLRVDLQRPLEHNLQFYITFWIFVDFSQFLSKKVEILFGRTYILNRRLADKQ